VQGCPWGRFHQIQDESWSRCTGNVRRGEVVRNEIGYDSVLMVDTNQIWEVDQSIEHIISREIEAIVDRRTNKT